MLNTAFRSNPLPTNLRERLHSFLNYAALHMAEQINERFNDTAEKMAKDYQGVRAAYTVNQRPLLAVMLANFINRHTDAVCLHHRHVEDLMACITDSTGEFECSMSVLTHHLDAALSRVQSLFAEPLFSVVDMFCIEQAFGKQFGDFTDADIDDLFYLINNQYVPFMIAAEDDGNTQLTVNEVVARAYDEASAIDIIARETIVLRRGEVKELRLKFRSSFDRTLCALILPRSGQGSKAGLSLVNTVGLIDADYRGEWIANVVMRDYDGLKQEELIVEQGKAVAQILVLPQASAQALAFYTDATVLDASTRGEGGFGSSDVAAQK